MDLEELRDTVKKTREKALVEESAPVNLLPDDVCKRIGDFPEWDEFIETESKEAFCENAILLEAWLRLEQPGGRYTLSLENIERIRKWIILNIIPPSSFSHRSSYDPAPPPLLTKKEILQWHALSTVGTRLLLHLHRLGSQLTAVEPSNDFVTCLTSYTDPRDPWTTLEANRDAEQILSSLFGHAGAAVEAKILGGVLTESVKPRFTKSKNPAVTEQGRRVIHPIPQPLELSEMETSSKPWKFRDIYTVTVYRWVLTRLTPSTLQQHWPLLIPPLLTVIDDEATVLKIKGCELLDVLMKVTPTDFLKRTGLGEVFEAALMPYLSYLPTLTPEEESIRLLNAVYPSLLLLAQTRFPAKDDGPFRQKALDKVMRVGILTGYWHVSENVKVAEMLVQRMADVIAAMKLLSVKHLKDLLPLLTSILSAPFCLSYPPLLHAAAHSLRILTLNAWPRIGRHRGIALKGLCLCWCKLERESKPLKPELSAVADDLLESLKVLEAAFKATKVDVSHEFKLLRESNPALESFFPAQELRLSELKVAD